MITVGSILSSLNNIDGMLRTLEGVELLFDEYRAPIYSVGNSAVVVRASYQGRPSLLKCYYKHHPYLYEIYGDRYHPAELSLFSIDGRREWCDVVVDDWRDGVTLLRMVERCSQRGDRDVFRCLAHNFDKLALELLCAPWAHGDLTLENIIVGDDLTLSLIDFDASYIPTLSIDESYEGGTSCFNHPSRGNAFNKDIDSYPIAFISTGLHILSLHPELFDKGFDGLLFSPDEILSGECELYLRVLDIFAHRGMAVEYQISKLLASHDYRLPSLQGLLKYSMRDKFTLQPQDSYIEGALWGFTSDIASGSQVVILPLYSLAFDFSCGVAAVKVGDYWHYINTQGEVVMKCCDCMAIKPACDNAFRVQRSGEWKLIPFKTEEDYTK